jgi:hypothetical protein
MKWLLVAIPFLLFSQSLPTFPTPTANFKYTGWVNNCVNDRPGTIRYLGACTPRSNATPTGTWYPDTVGTCKFWRGSNTQTPMKIVGPNGSVLAYSTQTPFSYKNKYIMLSRIGSGGVSYIYNLKTCALVRTAPHANVGKANWSNYDPEKLYYLDSSTKKLRLYNVAANTSTDIITFNGTGGYPNLTGLTMDGTSEMTKDEWMVIHSPPEDTFCLVNLNIAPPNTPAYCVTYTSDLGTGSVDFIQHTNVDSVTGLRYVMLQGLPSSQTTSLWQWSDASPTPVFLNKVENTAVGATGDRDGIWETGETYMGTPHCVVSETADGQQFYASYDMTETSGNNWTSIGLFQYGGKTFGRSSAGGGIRDVYLNGSYSGAHYGNARHKPYILISNVTGQASNPTVLRRNYGDTSTPIIVASPNRALIVVENAGEYVHLVANTHGEIIESPPSVANSTTIGVTYWPHPFGAMSMDGSLIAFQSTWGKDDYLQVTVVEWKRDAKNLRVTERTNAGFTLRYTGPDVTACTRKIDNNSDFSSPLIDESDGGGKVQRSKVFNTGAAGTTYYIRVTCGTQNADFSATTLN